MARRGNPPQTGFDASLRPRVVLRPSAPIRRDAVRRGAILGNVFAGHFVVLMLVLHPSWRRIEPVRSQHEADVFRLTFDPLPEIPRSLSVRALARIPGKVQSAQSAIASPKSSTAVVTRATNSPPATTTDWVVAVAQPTAGDLHGGYGPSDFRTALQNAQRAKANHIPGVATPLIGGIQLQASSSVKGAVHAVTEYIRCTDKQLEMENGRDQFSTPQLMDRALQLDGCGPHLEESAVDATADGISHRATSDN